MELITKPYHSFFWRFVFCYFVLYLLPIVPAVFYDWAVPWVGREVLKIPYPITVKPNGSGDTTYNYVQLFIIFWMATMGAGLWSLLPLKNEKPKHLCLTVFLRLALGYIMLTYGFVKVWHTQFPDLSLQSLVTTYGESSPMGLVWRFMGYSAGYNLFTGGAEVLCGVLLFYRRTAMLGALLAAGVMAHVLVLNLCYDIPVKLFSAHLLMMALLLLLPDAARLWRFFILHQAIEPRSESLLFQSPRLNRLAAIGKTLLIVAVTYMHTMPAFFRQPEPRHPLYGLYQVVDFQRNGKATAIDQWRWRYVIVEWRDLLTIQTLNGKWLYCEFKANPKKQTATLRASEKDKPQPWTYQKQSDEQLSLKGKWGPDTLVVHLKKQDPNQLLLNKRGFNWIDEYPMNR